MDWSVEPLWMLFVSDPAPTPEPRPRPTGDGRREYFRQRDRETKELAKEHGTLMGFSTSRAARLLKKYGQGGLVEDL